MLAGLLLSVAMAAIPATDIVAVDDYIDAPRELFGRTRAAVEGTLGPPASIESRVLPGGRRAAIDPVDELSYRGVVIAVSRASGGVRRVEITEPHWALPGGLTVGTPRNRVEQHLGEPQATSDASVLYLYSDGFPNTVEFSLRDGRVRRIEWLYAAAD